MTAPPPQELFRFIGQRPASYAEPRVIRTDAIIAAGAPGFTVVQENLETQVAFALRELQEGQNPPPRMVEHLESDAIRYCIASMDAEISTLDLLGRLGDSESLRAIVSDDRFVRDRFRSAVGLLGVHYELNAFDPDLCSLVLAIGESLTIASEAAEYDFAPKFSEAIDDWFVTVPTYWSSNPPREALAREPSIGDLMLVKQKLTGYHMGEIAAIENVMASETRTHRLRREQFDEQTVELETLKEEVTESEKSQNERSELKTEIERTLEQQFSLHGDVRVESSLGPTTNLTANVGAEFSSSTSETNKNASEFAKSTVERALNRVTKRSLERRITVKRVTSLDDESRGFQNETADHISGIYRWVESDWEATLHNYGERLLLEFLIPEPGAWLSRARNRVRSKQVELREPHLPMIIDVNGLRPLLPQDLNDGNFGHYVQLYLAQGVPAPPALTTTVAASLKLGEPVQDMPASAAQATALDTLVVPEGYEAVKATVALMGFSNLGMREFMAEAVHTIRVAIAGKQYPSPPGDTINASAGVIYALDYQHEFTLEIPVTGKVPVAIWSDFGRGLVGVVTLQANLRTDALRRWQELAFERILMAYSQAREAYEARVAAANANLSGDVAASELNITRSHILGELKKAIIGSLNPGRKGQLANPLGLTSVGDAFQQGNGEPEPWLASISDREQSILSFLEQSIEWPTLQYITYPYFWTSADRWIERFTDSFEKDILGEFLSAGAARVVVAVPEPFWKHMLYYLETGRPWSGGRPPIVKSDSGKLSPDYVSIAQEIQQRTDDRDESPALDSWTYSMPTNLVMLQDGKSLSL